MRSKDLSLHSRQATRERNLRRVSIPAELGGTTDVELARILDAPQGFPAFTPTIVLRQPSYRTLTIIVPVYNERQTVMALLEKVLLQDTSPLAKEIIVVDDCSTDGTRELLKSVDWEEFCQDSGDTLQLLLHDCNRGKGAGIRTALEQAKGELVQRQVFRSQSATPHQWSSVFRPRSLIRTGEPSAV